MSGLLCVHCVYTRTTAFAAASWWKSIGTHTLQKFNRKKKENTLSVCVLFSLLIVKPWLLPTLHFSLAHSTPCLVIESTINAQATQSISLPLHTRCSIDPSLFFQQTRGVQKGRKRSKRNQRNEETRSDYWRLRASDQNGAKQVGSLLAIYTTESCKVKKGTCSPTYSSTHTLPLSNIFPILFSTIFYPPAFPRCFSGGVGETLKKHAPWLWVLVFSLY